MADITRASGYPRPRWRFRPCVSQNAPQERTVDIVALAPIVLLVVAFYFLLIRPQKQRQRQQSEMVSALAPGAQVMTTAGIMGTVAVVAEDELSLEISPGVFVRMVPASVAKVIEPAPSVETAPETDEAP
ncbi:MAG: preprotein translocase subunit YajC [Rubrivirga sp.]|nr:preprotein translocase subunit YajC [Rubrivirga sp.]